MDLRVACLIFCIACNLWMLGYGGTALNVLDYGAKGDGSTDDSEAFSKAWKDLCNATDEGQVPTLVIPQERTFLLQPLNFEGPCKSKNVNIQILGTIVAPGPINAWKGCDKNWLIFFNISGLTVEGPGMFNGRGYEWWDTINKNGNEVPKEGCPKPVRGGPKTLGFEKCDGLKLNKFTSQNSSGVHIDIKKCVGATVSNLNILAPDESPNTDGLIISSTHVNIYDTIIRTGDDCITIKGGAAFLNVTRVACGPGNGISIGSLGKLKSHETVEELNIWNCSFNGSSNGARIKTYPGGAGFVKAISFTNITLTNVDNPIIIDQHYGEKGDPSLKNEANAVEVSNVIFSGLYGTGTKDVVISLDCSKVGCRNLTLDNINLKTTAPGKTAIAVCNNVQGSISRSVTPPVKCVST